MGGNPYVVNRHAPTFGADVESWNPERWLGSAEDHKQREQSMLTVRVLQLSLFGVRDD